MAQVTVLQPFSFTTPDGKEMRSEAGMLLNIESADLLLQLITSGLVGAPPEPTQAEIQLYADPVVLCAALAAVQPDFKLYADADVIRAGDDH
jgi:hypothetical protein